LLGQIYEELNCPNDATKAYNRYVIEHYKSVYFGHYNIVKYAATWLEFRSMFYLYDSDK